MLFSWICQEVKRLFYHDQFPSLDQFAASDGVAIDASGETAQVEGHGSIVSVELGAQHFHPEGVGELERGVRRPAGKRVCHRGRGGGDFDLNRPEVLGEGHREGMAVDIG